MRGLRGFYTWFLHHIRDIRKQFKFFFTSAMLINVYVDFLMSVWDRKTIYFSVWDRKTY